MEFSFHTTLNSTQQQHVQKHYLCISQPQKFYLKIVSQKLNLYTSIYGRSKPIPEKSIQLDNVDHFPVLKEKRNHCKFPGCKGYHP